MTTLRNTRFEDAWDGQQARVANEHMRDLLSILNGGASIRDQFGGIKASVRWNSDDGVTIGPFARPPRWVLCLGARLKSAPSSVVSGAPVTWTMVGANVSIVSIGGLTAATDYDVDFWCVEG